MNNIGKINGYNVAPNYMLQQESKEDLSKQATNESVAGKDEQKQVSSNDVYGFLAARNACTKCNS